MNEDKGETRVRVRVTAMDGPTVDQVKLIHGADPLLGESASGAPAHGVAKDLRGVRR